MVLDRRMLLPVLDTNALLVEACALAKSGGRQDRVTVLAVTGRATPYIAAHVPGEVDEHLAKVAADLEASERQARRVLNEQILPALRVVDLEIRDHLAPQTRHILRVDREMPKRHRGDPDDAPTMALAEFLGPCVIVSKDSVFSRFGFAVIDWIPVAESVLRLAGAASIKAMERCSPTSTQNSRHQHTICAMVLQRCSQVTPSATGVAGSVWVSWPVVAAVVR
jgi:hypothetical protein